MKLKKWLYALRTCLAAEWAAKAGLAERADVAVDAGLFEWRNGRIGRLASIEVDPVEPADVPMCDEFFRRWLELAWAPGE